MKSWRGWDPHICLPSALCPYPFARRPGPPIGGSCRSQQGSSTRRAPTWGAASRRPGLTMRRGGLLRRYGQPVYVPEGPCAEPGPGLFCLCVGCETEHFLISFLCLFPLVHFYFLCSPCHSFTLFLPFFFFLSPLLSFFSSFPFPIPPLTFFSFFLHKYCGFIIGRLQCNHNCKTRRKPKSPQILPCACFMFFVPRICFSQVW